MNLHKYFTVFLIFFCIFKAAFIKLKVALNIFEVKMTIFSKIIVQNLQLKILKTYIKKLFLGIFQKNFKKSLEY